MPAIALEQAHGSYREFSELSRIKDSENVTDAKDMIRALVDDYATLVTGARELFKVAEVAGDPASADLAVRRIDVAEKNAWMLRSHLQ